MVNMENPKVQFKVLILAISKNVNIKSFSHWD